jgi:hypothetical protein
MSADPENRLANVERILDRMALASEKNKQEFEERLRKREEEAAAWRKEDEARRKEDEARRKEDEARMRKREAEDEARRKEDEARRKETEAWRKDSEAAAKKLHAELAETGRYIAAVGKQIGGLDDNFGHMVETLFADSLRESLTFNGVHYDKVVCNFAVRNGAQDEAEFDTLMFNDEAVALVEIKSRLHPNFVDEMVYKKAANFRRWLPEYAQRKLYLGIGTMSFSVEAAKRAEKLGVSLLCQKGNKIEYAVAATKSF